ncbi:hypothetical protein RHMOL_Rhmol12G0187900 [Rhododendron molle]|uniref:Uncharacterized protein n=1 Tax=Rhododendron molle TaxID=49168 RepID=A0ACC0LJZ7_RHOML|nr:hypothetical protein RHMOL_Rhmol12G0187900 [Rhododendron molle]
MEQCSSVLKKLPPPGQKCLEAKWNRGCAKMDEGRISSQSVKNTCNLRKSENFCSSVFAIPNYQLRLHRKLLSQKIIIIPVEALVGKKACECAPPVFLNKQCTRNTLPNGRKKSEANKSQEVVNVSIDDRTLYVVDNPKVKTSTIECRKRGLPGLGNVNGMKKRRKLDLIVLEQRSRILKQGREPKVNTLQKGVNVSTGDWKLFVAQITQRRSPLSREEAWPTWGWRPKEKRQKLVCDAMEQCSSVLKKLPPPGQKCLEAKWNHGCSKMDEGCISSQSVKNTCNLR